VEESFESLEFSMKAALGRKSKRTEYPFVEDGSRVLSENLSPYHKKRVIPPVFATSRGVLYNCDCLELLRSIKNDSIDSIFADPPFNLGKDYGNEKVNDRLEKKAYLDWSFSWLEECARIVKPGGALFVYILPQWAYHFGAFLDDKLTFRHWIAVSMKGTFPRGKKLYPAHYALLYFTKGMPSRFNRVRLPIPVCRHCGKDIKDYGGHRKYLNPAGLNLTDFWDDTSPNRHQKFKVRKVNELKPMIPQRALLVSTDVGDIILDPFGGGGSTYQAAEEMGRLWVGCEIADCRPIIMRFKEKVGLTASGTPPDSIKRMFKSPTKGFGFEIPWR
jgi:site-specific DNA-methyltransferase (adenine-specific)